MSNNDRVYRDLKIFIEGDDGKKRPLTIGYCYDDGDKVRFQLTCDPKPGAKTNWSGVIESREDRGQSRGTGQRNGGGQRSQRDDDSDGIPF